MYVEGMYVNIQDPVAETPSTVNHLELPFCIKVWADLRNIGLSV